MTETLLSFSSRNEFVLTTASFLWLISLAFIKSCLDSEDRYEGGLRFTPYDKVSRSTFTLLCIFTPFAAVLIAVIAIRRTLTTSTIPHCGVCLFLCHTL